MDVLPTAPKQSVKSIAATVKQRVEPMHIVILKPALSFAALRRINTKFKTPKTTARYKSKIAAKSIAKAPPRKSDDTRPINDPQFIDNNELRVKSTRERFVDESETKGSVIV